ncbi:MAG: hypothetical protein IPH68_15590 [Chitinophagaceae bacterium]|nr:hypothetical protein [Chitinophagaceae bacterium]
MNQTYKGIPVYNQMLVLAYRGDKLASPGRYPFTGAWKIFISACTVRGACSNSLNLLCSLLCPTGIALASRWLLPLTGKTTEPLLNSVTRNFRENITTADVDRRWKICVGSPVQPFRMSL